MVINQFKRQTTNIAIGTIYSHFRSVVILYYKRRRGRDCMVVGFTTTYAISAYHH